MKNILVSLEKNTKGRDFVCGDIHGCFDALEAGLKAIRFDFARDRLLCVGDLIDRGPRSQDALGYYHKDWFYTVQGNHENLFAQQYEEYGSQYRRYNFGNGNGWTRTQTPAYLAALWEAVRDLPLIIQVEDALILHARLPAVDSLEAISADPDRYAHTLLWRREGLPQDITIPGITRIYCGHTIVPEPVAYKGTLNIDTGAFLAHWEGYSGKLTILPLADRTFF